MTDPVLRSERHGKVALLTLNRPQARNALNAALAGALCDAIAASQDAGCIVITGADPAFCAGLDLRNLGVETLAQLPSYTAAQVGSKIPMIAAVNGPAVTGGFEVALLCDFMIASERAVFADTHLRVGVYPGPVVVDLPRRVGGAWARQMSLSGDFVDAQTALRIGLVNDVVPHDELLPRTMKIAQAIAEQPRDMVVALRADWDESVDVPVAEGRRVHTRHAIDGGFGRNRGEDIAARREAVLARSRDQRGG
ncbi:enoyl-CoA hydratase [uncultured Phenylobacterium sp.]|uniref:enoyl-CoA hydratase n=1 Tax=uncultured Phenylobacterium sp. TaxID=349273 RepID=UPI0025EC9427|nr:enoyl-CoA hydratase [uncultured Phenylobacterium sp.]